MASRRHWLIAAAVTAAVVFAATWVGFAQNWAWLTAADSWLLRVFHDFGVEHPGWVSFWVVFCIVFGPTAFRLLALPLIVFALVRRNWQTALFLVLTLEVSDGIANVVKLVSNRPRPPSALVYGISTSFPSGHAVAVMVGVLALLTVFLPAIPKRLYTPVIVAGALLVFLVGTARVVLNVHNPSDVVAGWALGFLYYLLCVRLVPPRPIMTAAETPAALDSVP